MAAPDKIKRIPLKQPTPAELVDDVMLTIREVYCINWQAAEWMKLQSKVREWCVLWPAKFIVGKGFSLPADRFKQILTGIVTDSKRHVTAEISYLPAFLGKCVQSHFQIHWEEYYAEAKSARQTAEAALLALGKLPTAQDRTVENLAAVAAVLNAKKGKRKVKLESADKQGSLF